MLNVKPCKSWAFFCIVALVIAAHLATLQSITHVLNNHSAQAPSLVNAAFTTRTIQRPPPPQATPLPTAQATTAPSKRPSISPTPTNTALPLLSDATMAPQKISDSAPPATTQGLIDSTHPSEVPTAEVAATEPTPPQAEVPAVNTTASRYTIPAPARLKYDIKGEIKGFAYFANGSLLWQHNGGNYDAQLEISHFILGSRTQTSSGQLTTHGLEPLRFADKARSEVAAQFDHVQNLVIFSADGSRTTLQEGAQDQLSVFFQLSALLAGEPQRYKQGDKIPFQAVGARSSEDWIFTVHSLETLTLPGGTVQAMKLVRHPPNQSAPQVEVWLAPRFDYLPVRIRLTQGDGDFVEQQWRATQKP